MKRTKKIVLALVAAVTLFGCKNQINVVDSSTNVIEKITSENILLGEKKNNPFSLQAARAANTNVPPNYYYFRLRTDNIEKLETLKKSYPDLSTLPFDYEIIEGGCFYEDNVGENNNSPWFYFSLPTLEYLDLAENYEIAIWKNMFLYQM